MMKTIKEYTEYLLNCLFTDDDFDPEDHEEHLKMCWELLDHYFWAEIYPVWNRYLHMNCSMPEDVINFVNLYVYYDVSNLKIPDPIEFVSYLYYRVDMDEYWDEAGELFDGLAINILSKHGLVNMMDNPYYNPLKDERILNGISNWKNGQAN